MEIRLRRYGGWVVVRTLNALNTSFSYSDPEPVEKVQDRSDMTGLRSFNDSTSKRVLDLLGTG